MIRFCDENGKDIDLGFVGQIWCFYDNKPIAINNDVYLRITKTIDGFDDIETEPEDHIGNPYFYDDWEIIIACGKQEASILQKSIAAAWATNASLATMCLYLERE